MNEKRKQKDLCTNCLNIIDCFYCKSKKEPVNFCEEFTSKDPVASLKEIERFERSKAIFLPIW